MATIGVKVQLDGSQTYKQNMSAVTQQTKLFQSEVKNLTTQMKNGSNTIANHKAQYAALEKQLVSQKQQEKLLTDEIAKQTEKYGANSKQVMKLEEQLNKCRTAISNTEAEMKSNGGAVGAWANALQQVGQKITNVGDKMQSVGGAMTKNFTMPIVAAAGASVAAWKDVDEGLDIVVQKTGATGKALKNMEKNVENLATTIPTTFEEAGTAVGEVNTRFGLTGKALETLSGQFIKFAELNNTDVSSSIDMTQKALSAFGLGADSAGALLDRMNQVGQQTGVSMDTLSSGLVNNAAAFQELGLNIDQSVILMGQLETSGANSEQVMNGLRKALKNAAADGVPLDQALSQLQDTIENGTGSVDGLTAAYDLFGRNGDQVYQAVKSGAIDFNDLASSVDNASGSVSNTFAETQDPLDQFTTTMNELKLVGAELVNTMGPALSGALKSLQGVISSLSKKWKGLSDDQQQVILKVTGIIAVVGPLLSTLGKATKNVGTFVDFIGTYVVPAIGTLISFITGTVVPIITGTVIPMIASVITAIAPFLPIIAAVVAAVVGVIAIVKNWGAITEWFKGVFGAVGDFIGDKVEAVKKFFGGLGDKIGEFKDGVATKFGEVKDTISQRWEETKQKTSETWDAIKSKVEQNGGGIKGILTTAMEGYKSLWSAGFNKLDEITGGKFSEIKNNISQKWDEISQKTSATWDAIKSKVEENGGGIKGVLTTAMEGYKSLWGAGFNWLNDVTGGKFGEMVGKAQGFANNLRDKFGEGMDNAKTKVYYGLLGIGEMFGNVKNSALTWGKDMIQNFIDGIQRMWNALKQKVTDVGNLIKDYLGFTEPDKGPLSNFHVFGQHMMQNYASSIDGAKYLVQNAVRGVATDVQGQLDEPIDYDRLYGAVRDGASSSTTRIVLNNREVTRALNGMGVVFNG